MDGLIKHNGPIYFFEDKKKFIFKFFKDKIVFDNYPSLEAQIASISDDIAYNNHDLEDGLRANLFNIESLNSIPLLSKLIKKHFINIKKFRREIIVNQIVRESINTMVNDVIKNTKNNLAKLKPKSLLNVYKSNQLIVDFSPKVKNEVLEIRNFLNINMYNNKKVIINTNEGKKIIRDLYIYLSKNYKKYIDKELLKNEHKERAVSDFIAGMTDRYAINLHKKVL